MAQCRSCGTEIEFLLTKTGKKIPVDAETVAPGETDFDKELHTSHFETCPDAEKWKKSRNAKA